MTDALHIERLMHKQASDAACEYSDEVDRLTEALDMAEVVVSAARHWLRSEYPNGAHTGYVVDEPARRVEDALRAYDRPSSDEFNDRTEADHG